MAKMLAGMSMNFISRPVLRATVAAFLVGCVLTIPAGAELIPLDCTQNAALHYWKAGALIRAPVTKDELEFARKADVLLADVSPAIFVSQPELLQWLLGTGAMLPALHQARACAVSQFTIRPGPEPFLDLSHLPVLRAATRRAHAMAKAYEFVDNTPGAAAIYVDLLKMVQHLDQDRNLISGFVAADLLQLNLSELESFLSRNQSAEAVAPLAEYFNSLPTPVFHPGKYLRDEVRRYGDWLLADPARAEERLSRLYRNTKSKPAVEKLITLDPQKKKARLKNWVDDYRERMADLADAVDLPFASGLPRVRRLDEQRESVQPSAPAPGDNPLVPLLVPKGADMYERFLLAEAQLSMLQILCAAAACRADTGFWPENIDAVSRHARTTMPKDPFSGEKFYYRLEGGMPVIITRVPKRMMSKKGASYHIGLGDRKKLDESNTAEAAKGIRDESVRDLSTPVPME